MEDYEGALSLVEATPYDSDTVWTVEVLKSQATGFFNEHPRLRTDQESRRSHNTIFSPALNKHSWAVTQVILDDEETNDWNAEFTVDLDKSREFGKPILCFEQLKK